MSVKTFFILSVSLIVAYSARAQRATPGNDTVLKGSSIEVIQAYKPQIKQAPKPEWIPQLPPSDTTHPPFNYDVPQQTLYYTYSSLPLRPLALGKEQARPPFPNYIKLGGGNLSTLFLDAGVGGISGKNYETDIHLHHISQQGKIVNQQSALSGIEAEGMFHNNQSDWHTAIIAERNQYNYYGGDQSAYFLPDSIKQVYTTIRAVVDMKNKQDSNTVLNYHPAINASFYNARLNASEITIGLSAPVTYKIDSNLDFQGALTGAFTSYNVNSVATNNNFIELQPGINLHKDPLNGHALFGFALGKGSNIYFLPDILIAYNIGAKFTVSGGWQALLRQNTYEQLTTENPYLSGSYTVMQSKTQEAFINLTGNSGDHLSFSGRISWWNLNSLPTFLNDIGDHRQFYVDYQDVKAISFKTAARYQVANTWSLGVTGDFYSFSGGAEKYVWQQPATKIKGDFMVIPVHKLTVTAYLALLGGIYSKDFNHNVVKLNMIADIGGNAEYQIIPRLSAFAQVNNLFNDKYQRWYSYQVYGLNIYGGIRLKF